ncbi:MAG: universal stress protein, partial [Catenulispora sp.]|nr:universal stress protein [Catenulispora sp.]
MNTTVVVGYDQTGHSDAALDVAAGEAVMRGASLTVVTAFRRPAPAGSAVAAPPDPDDAPAKAAMAVAEYGADRARARHSRLIAIARTVDGPAGKSLAQAAHGAGLL